jgi:spermidine synthase
MCVNALTLSYPDGPHISGLGIGTAARSLIEHGLSVSVCEIDPAVYDFARRYFALPVPSTVYLEDARKLLRRARGLLQYDVIVHDVVRRPIFQEQSG